MESLERSKAIIDLGKKLIAKLKLGDDELAQWMAHLLAERIHNAETANLEDRVTAQNSCAELIFRLWAQRYSLPDRLRPLEKLEPLLNTLDALDTSNRPRFRFMDELQVDLKVEEHVATMLDIAIKIDDASRIMVQYFLATAAEQASEEAKPWILSAIDAGADVMLEARIINFVDHGINGSDNVDEIALSTLKSKIQKLEAFASLAASLAAELIEKQNAAINEISVKQNNQ